MLPSNGCRNYVLRYGHRHLCFRQMDTVIMCPSGGHRNPVCVRRTPKVCFRRIDTKFMFLSNGSRYSVSVKWKPKLCSRQMDTETPFLQCRAYTHAFPGCEDYTVDCRLSTVHGQKTLSSVTLFSVTVDKSQVSKQCLEAVCSGQDLSFNGSAPKQFAIT